MSGKEIVGAMKVPAILLSGPISDGEEITEDYGRIGSVKKLEAVLTDLEASSDEDEPLPRPFTPSNHLGSSEAEVCETVYDPTIKTPTLKEVLTDVENFNTSGEEDIDEDEISWGEADIILSEGFDVSIADKVKTKCHPVSRKFVRNRHSEPTIEYIDDVNKRNYLTPVSKLLKKKKRKNRVLLNSCLTDTEDVDVPSDVDTNIQVQRSTSLFKSHSKEAEKLYQTRIKSKPKLDQCSLLEFLSNKMEEGMLTDIDDIQYSDDEGDDDPHEEVNYELDFPNEINDKETLEKSRRSSPSESGVRIEVSGSDDNSFQPTGKIREKRKAEVKASQRIPSFLKADEPSGGITDVEDVDYSDHDDELPLQPCPTPEEPIWENSNVTQNEAFKEKPKDNLSVKFELDPLTDSEDLLIRSPQLRNRKKTIKPAPVRSGWAYHEVVELSDNEGARTPGSESGDTDLENFSDVDPEDFRPLAVTPDVLTDDSFILGVEGSGDYLAAAKGRPSPIRVSLLRTISPSPCPTDTEDFIGSADDEPYPQPHTPPDLQLDDISSIIHVKNTRTFVTDGEESLYVKGTDLHEPLTDIEDMADAPSRI